MFTLQSTRHTHQAHLQEPLVSSILTQVVTHGHRRITKHSTHIPLQRLTTHYTSLPPAHNFTTTVRTGVTGKRTNIVTRIGHTSPDHNILHTSFSPTSVNHDCTHNNTTYLSILASRSFFRNRRSRLITTHRTSNLPILHGSFAVST